MELPLTAVAKSLKKLLAASQSRLRLWKIAVAMRVLLVAVALVVADQAC